VNSVVDNWTTVGIAAGGHTITTTMTGTKSPASEQDYWFGLLTSTTLQSFPNTSAVLKKYGTNPSWDQNLGNQQACSPFNGPGGVANPSFTITLNGQKVPGRFQGTGAQCQNPCTSTLVMDPVAYMTPGAQYDVNGNLLGPQINPFTLNPNDVYAVQSHSSQYANYTSGGTTSLGSFLTPVSIGGVTKYEYTN